MLDNSVSVRRLQWLQEQYDNGRSFFASASFNPANQTEKIKFVVSNDVHSPTSRPSLQYLLDAVQKCMATSIVTDKGHRSSGGQSVVEFWIKAVSTGNAQHRQDNSICADVVPPLLPPMIEQERFAFDEESDRIDDMLHQVDYPPPVPPPLLENNMLEIIEYKFDGLARTLAMLAENVSTHMCYTQCLCQYLQEHSSQALIEAQSGTITALRSRGTLEQQILEKLDAIERAPVPIIHAHDISEALRPILSNMVDNILNKLSNLEAIHHDLRAYTEKLDIEKYNGVVWQQFVQTHVSLSSMRNEIVAKVDTAIRDLRDEILVGLIKSGSHHVATQTVDSNSGSNSENVAEDVELDEDLVPLSECQYKKNTLFRRRVGVAHEGILLYGIITSISVGEQSGLMLYRVRYDDGDYGDFTREEVQQWLL